MNGLSILERSVIVRVRIFTIFKPKVLSDVSLQIVRHYNRESLFHILFSPLYHENEEDICEKIVVFV